MSFKFFSGAVLTALVVLFSNAGLAENATGDRFRNFAELHEEYGGRGAYRIVLAPRKSRALVLAIHGGTIEPMTSEIAQRIARDDMGLYIFEGRDIEEPWDLHVTSHRFDEPLALSLVSKSEVAISIHGYKEETPRVLVGGLNDEFRMAVMIELQLAGFAAEVEFPSDAFAGTHPNNIVNRPKNQSVQLEFSSGMRKRFEEDREYLNRFTHAVRKAVIFRFACSDIFSD
jgi:phage replication-related protein YjqB (UPF0714/DUF867 family)